MPFLSISDQDVNDRLAEAVVVREREVMHYDINIRNYEVMLKGDFPTEIDIKFRDHLTELLASEKVERAKAQRVLDALVSRLPADTIKDLVAAAVTRVDAPVK